MTQNWQSYVTCCTLVVLTCSIGSLPSKANEYAWVDPNGGIFTDVAAWSVLSEVGAPPPAADDTAVFNIFASYNVMFLGQPTTRNLYISASDVVFQPSGPSRTYTVQDVVQVASGSLTLGSPTGSLNLDVQNQLFAEDNGTINIVGGSVLSAFELGLASRPRPSGGGEINVRGTGSALHVESTEQIHRIGVARNGSLNIEDDATATFNGTLELGVGTDDIDFGHGLVNVQSGGLFQAEAVRVGGGLNRSGEIHGADAGTRIQLNDLVEIGGAIGQGTGTVHIGQEASLASQSIHVFATGSLNASHSSLTVHGDLIVDAGNVSVAADSTFQLAPMKLISAGNGAVLDLLAPLVLADDQNVLLNSGSALTTGSGFSVGVGSAAAIDVEESTLNISQGGTVGSMGEIRIFSGILSADGNVVVDGGRITHLGHSFLQGSNLNLTVKNGGQVAFGRPMDLLPNRAIHVENGGRLTATVFTFSDQSDFSIEEGGTFAAQLIDYTGSSEFPVSNGRIEFDGFLGDLNAPSGTVAPGREFPAQAVISRSYVQQAGVTLEIELGGRVLGAEYDQLFASQTAQLDGLLEVQLVDLGTGIFVPQLGDSFEVVSAPGGIIGEFAATNLPSLDGSLDWDLSYLANSVILDVIQSLAADFDGDGDVDGDDFLVWQTSFSNDNEGDADGDGDTDGDDFLIWQSEFGSVSGRSAGAPTHQPSVPEPSAVIALAMVIGLGMMLPAIVRKRGY